MQEMQETQVQFLGQEDLQEEEMVTNSSILPVEFYGQRDRVGYSPWGLKCRTWLRDLKKKKGINLFDPHHNPKEVHSLDHTDFRDAEVEAQRG